MMKLVRLSELADIDISGVDKKTVEGETPVVLCNFTDVYYNWDINSLNSATFMRASAKKAEIEKFRLKKGDVLITKDSETRDDIGIACYVADELDNVILGYHCALIRPRKGICGAYLNACLQSSFARKHFSNQASGSGQRYTLTAEGIKNVIIPMRPFEEQERIGNLFQLISHRISIDKQGSSIIQRLCEDYFTKWFLKFDFPNGGSPYRSSGGEMSYSEELHVDIPVGWRVLPLKEVIQHINTGLNPRDNFVLNDGPIKYVTVKNLKGEGRLDFLGCDTISVSTKRLINKRSQINTGDILFASIAPLGRCYLIYEEPIEWEINESVFSIRPNTSIVSPEFLFLFFLSKWFVVTAEHNSVGSIFNGIRVSEIERMKVAIPPKDIMDAFTNLVSPMLRRKHLFEKNMLKMEELRNYLLPILINGQAKA